MSLLTSSSSYSYKNTNSKYVVCNEVVDLARLLSGLRQENLSDILILSFSFYYHEFVIKKKTQVEYVIEYIKTSSTVCHEKSLHTNNIFNISKSYRFISTGDRMGLNLGTNN